MRALRGQHPGSPVRAREQRGSAVAAIPLRQFEPVARQEPVVTASDNGVPLGGREWELNRADEVRDLSRR
jgi:hypothetical protein